MYIGIFRLFMFAPGKFDIDELERYMFLVEDNHDQLNKRRGAPSVEFENHF
jgi:hypothetical protein